MLAAGLEARRRPDGHRSDARQAGLDDLSDNLDRLPVVTLARLGRTYGIFHPMASHQGDVRREAPVAAAMLVSYWVLAAGAVAGAVVLHRRRVPSWPLLSLVGLSFLVTVSSTATCASGHRPRSRSSSSPRSPWTTSSPWSWPSDLSVRPGRAADDVPPADDLADLASPVGAQPSGRR